MKTQISEKYILKSGYKFLKSKENMDINVHETQRSAINFNPKETLSRHITMKLPENQMQGESFENSKRNGFPHKPTMFIRLSLYLLAETLKTRRMG